jgi:hypothetical protein
MSRANGRRTEGVTRSYSTRIGSVRARLRFKPGRNILERRERGRTLTVEHVAAVARLYEVEGQLEAAETPGTPA